MNKEYAIEILEMVERHTLERTSNLFVEAYRYYNNLKKTDSEIKQRFYKQKFK